MGLSPVYTLAFNILPTYLERCFERRRERLTLGGTEVSFTDPSGGFVGGFPNGSDAASTARSSMASSAPSAGLSTSFSAMDLSTTSRASGRSHGDDDDDSAAQLAKPLLLGMGWQPHGSDLESSSHPANAANTQL
jgi:hypothetical protein